MKNFNFYSNVDALQSDFQNVVVPHLELGHSFSRIGTSKLVSLNGIVIVANVWELICKKQKVVVSEIKFTLYKVY